MTVNKGKTTILFLIAAIMAIVLVFVPQFIFIGDIEDTFIDIRWLFGFIIDIEFGEIDYIGITTNQPRLFTGMLYSVLIIIIALFILITVIINKFAKIEIPFISLMCLLSGIILLLIPLFLRLSYLMIYFIRGRFLFDYFLSHIDLNTTIYPILGLLVIIGSLLEITRKE